MQKRGISDVVTMVMVILLVIAAIVLVWNFLKPTLEESGEQISVAQFSSEFEVIRPSVFIDGPNIHFSVQRKSGNDPISALNLILYDKLGKVAAVRSNVLLRIAEDNYNALDVKSYQVNYKENGLDREITKIEVVPIYKTPSGKEITSGVRFETKFASGVPAGGEGSGGQVETWTNMSSCQVISAAGYYKLNQTVTASASPYDDGSGNLFIAPPQSCLVIMANDVVIDGNGYEINTSYGRFDMAPAMMYSINATSRNNITVKNFANMAGYGFGGLIWFENVTNSLISNVSLMGNQFSNWGIYISGTGNIVRDVTSNLNLIISSGTGNQPANNQVFNNHLGGISISFSNNNYITNNYISNAVVWNAGLSFDNSSNNFVSNNTVTNLSVQSLCLFGGSCIYMGGNGISLSNSNNNYFADNTASLNKGNGITLRYDSSNNTFVNQNVFGNVMYQIYSTVLVTNNFLVYNNSYGKWEFINPSFRQNITINGTLTYPGTIVIGSNSAYFNNSAVYGGNAAAMNSSANITLYDIPVIAGAKILKNGVDCGGGCYNFTALSGTVKFNVSSGGMYNISA